MNTLLKIAAPLVFLAARAAAAATQPVLTLIDAQRVMAGVLNFGGNGESVIAGWNAVNRVLLTRHARPGQEIHIAIFGINGQISDTPSNYIFVREAQLEVRPGPAGPAAAPVQEVDVEVERTDPALDAIVPRNVMLYKLAEGFEFTEGPVWSHPGGYRLLKSDGAVYFTERDRTLVEGTIFADLTQQVPGEEALDGMKVDKRGHLFVSVAGEVWVFDDTGKHLGTIRAPKPVHNFAWGGSDGKTLYLTARSTLYRLPLLVEGMRP